MQKKMIINVLASALNPKRLPVMLKKITRRISDKKGMLSKSENLDWIRAHSSEFSEFANNLDPELWEEAQNYGKRLQRHAEVVLSEIEGKLGGGGAYHFLYFLTRYMKPDAILETGVAAGFSTHAFLSAIKKNSKGRLFSSDFPYVRLADPEKYIGVLVEEDLKSDWELFFDGDRSNLPEILKKIEKIDLFHYDSDKSYSGREFAMSQVEQRISQEGVIVFDDVQDNSHFHDYINERGIISWKVFEYEDKYIGLIGQFAERAG